MPSLPIAPISPINSHRKKAVSHAATVLLPLIRMFCMQRCHRCPSSAWFSIAKQLFPIFDWLFPKCQPTRFSISFFSPPLSVAI